MKKILCAMSLLLVSVFAFGCNNSSGDGNSEAVITKNINNQLDGIMSSMTRFVTIKNNDLSIDQLMQSDKTVSNSSRRSESSNDSGFETNKTNRSFYRKKSERVNNYISGRPDFDESADLNFRSLKLNTNNETQNSQLKLSQKTKLSNSLSGYVERIEALSEISNDTCAANSEFKLVKDELVMMCARCKTFINKIRKGDIELDNKQLLALKEYSETLSDNYNNLKNCNSGATDAKAVINLKKNFSQNCDALIAKYLKVINNIDNCINYCESATATINELNNYISSIDESGSLLLSTTRETKYEPRYMKRKNITNQSEIQQQNVQNNTNTLNDVRQPQTQLSTQSQTQVQPQVQTQMQQPLVQPQSQIQQPLVQPQSQVQAQQQLQTPTQMQQPSTQTQQNINANRIINRPTPLPTPINNQSNNPSTSVNHAPNTALGNNQLNKSAEQSVQRQTNHNVGQNITQPNNAVNNATQFDTLTRENTNSTQFNSLPRQNPVPQQNSFNNQSNLSKNVEQTVQNQTNNNIGQNTTQSNNTLNNTTQLNTFTRENTNTTQFNSLPRQNPVPQQNTLNNQSNSSNAIQNDVNNNISSRPQNFASRPGYNTNPNTTNHSIKQYENLNGNNVIPTMAVPRVKHASPREIRA